MKKTILKISIRLACFGILLSGALASAQATVWSKDHLESTGFDATKPNFVATADGAVYVTGHYKSAINVGQSIPNSGGTDIYLIKYDSSGNVVWSKGFGGAADDTVNAITTDASGNVYLGGTFNSSTIAFGATTLNASATSLFLVKIDSSGTVLWAKGSTHQTLNKDAIKALVVDAAGNVYAGGDFSNGVLKFDTTSLSNTSSTSDFFIEKMDASGSLQWVKSFGGNLNDNLNGLAVSNINGNFNIIAVGSFDSSTVTLNNSKTLTNTTNSSAAPFSDLFVVAFDGNGNAQWQKTGSGTKLDIAKAVATDTSGNIYVVGKTKSPTLTVDAVIVNNNEGIISYVLKLNASGVASNLVLNNSNRLDAVCVNSNSNTVYASGRILGYHNSAIAFNTNLANPVVFSKIDEYGSLCHNPAGEYSMSIAIDSNDNLILATFGEITTSVYKLIKKIVFPTPLNATIADLPSGGYTYFTDATGGSALDNTTPLIEGQVLYSKLNDNNLRNAIKITIPSVCYPTTTTTYHYFKDNDGDGYGSYLTTMNSTSSTPPLGYVTNSTDCDDTDATKFTTYYKYEDIDSDNHLKLVSTICAGATAPTGYVSVAQTADDCDDTNATVHPGAVEITNENMDFNGLDNDCNGYVDDTKVTTTYITALTNYIFCEKVRNAQKYKFYVTNSFSGLSWEIETTEPKIKVNELSGSRYVYDDYFYVAVALKRNNQWLPYGPTQYVYTQASPTTSISGGQCGKTFLNTDQIINVNPVYLADSYRLQVDTESEYINYDIPNGDNNFLLNILPQSDTNVYHISVTFLQGNKVFNYGQQCDINIKSSSTGGSSQSIITGANVTTNLVNCGTTLASIQQSIYATFVSGATSYKFSVTGNGITGSQVIETPNCFFSLTSLSNPMFGTTYTVSVTCLLNGVWSSSGSNCTVITPGANVTTQMVLCGTTLVALRQSIYCAVVNGATKYRFRVGGVNGQVVETPNRFFNLTQVGGQLGTTYGIEVAALLNGLSWSSYGSSCNVTTPSPARLKAKTFEVSAYPNPFDTAFNLSIETPNKEDVAIAVYDMMGKLVETHQVNPMEIANLQIGNNFAAGIYNVIVSQANEMQAIRLIRK